MVISEEYMNKLFEILPLKDNFGESSVLPAGFYLTLRKQFLDFIQFRQVNYA